MILDGYFKLLALIRKLQYSKVFSSGIVQYMYMNYFLLIRYLDMEKRYKQEMERRRGVTADFKVCNKSFKISELCNQ